MIEENLGAGEIALDAEDMAALESVQQKRNPLAATHD